MVDLIEKTAKSERKNFIYNILNIPKAKGELSDKIEKLIKLYINGQISLIEFEKKVKENCN